MPYRNVRRTQHAWLMFVLLACSIVPADHALVKRGAGDAAHMRDVFSVSPVIAPGTTSRSAIRGLPSSLNGSSRSSLTGDYLSDAAEQGQYHWSAEHLPLKVCIKPGTGVLGYESYMEDVISKSFDEWAAGSQGRIAWQRVESPEGADIVIHWTDRVTERQEGTEAGRTKVYARLNPMTQLGVIDKADMTLLTQLPDRDFTPQEIAKAYLHEVGHALGIEGHSKDCHDIMYYAISNTQGVHLTDRDRTTLNTLYDNAHPPQVASGAVLRKRG